MWQELRAELHGDGLEIVTVALDSAGAEAARPWIEAARPEHPALIDEQHVLDALFGIVNVPSGVWIDEAGMIVRPPEPAFSAEPDWEHGLGEGATEYQLRTLNLERKVLVEHEKYVAAVRDWAKHGAASRYVLSPDDVLRRSQPRSHAESFAAAHFELGTHLQKLGHSSDAVAHSGRRTGCNRRTGRTSARPGALSAPTSVRPTSTTPTGPARSSEPALTATTHRWTCKGGRLLPNRPNAGCHPGDGLAAGWGFRDHAAVSRQAQPELCQASAEPEMKQISRDNTRVWYAPRDSNPEPAD